MRNSLSSIEVCAGAGGQALGLEDAGFAHEALVEIDHHCRNTLRRNRPEWNVIENEQIDLRQFDGRPYKGVDLLAGGLPCPPFSVAGKQLGHNDERNLFPEAIRLVDQIRPKAVMIENVRGILDAVFADYREELGRQLHRLGYHTEWRLLNASKFGVPQLRPRVVIIAMKSQYTDHLSLSESNGVIAPTVGASLFHLMKAHGWREALSWRKQANDIAPTIVGGSKKHGGPDLGPTRAKRAWASLGVDGAGIADEPPARDFTGMPRLTVPMVARLQGFPADWQFTGRKTPAYRQVGNAFPPPVATAAGERIAAALKIRRFVQVVA